MKKKTMMMLIAVTAAMVMATPGKAQTRPGFEVGVQLLQNELRQRVEGDLVEQDKGRFSGIIAGYTKTFRNGAFVRGRLNVAVGQADIRASDGATLLTGVDQSAGRLELHAGRDFALNATTTISPFAGLGSYVLTDDSGGHETESGIGYDRKFGYAYVPLGAQATFALPRNAVITLTGQYDWFLRGNAESHLSDVDAQLPNVDLEINGASGYEIDATIGIPLGAHRLNVGPFYRRWTADRSKSITLPGNVEFFEPSARTTETGVRLSFAF